MTDRRRASQQRQRPRQAQASPQRPRQARQAARPQPPRQQLTIDDALNTLHSMFGAVDKEVIHMILIEGCAGNMEAAVEALLQMTGGAPQSQSQPPPPPPPPPQSQSQAQSRPRKQSQQQHQQQQQQQQQRAQNAIAIQQSMISLPMDFLRPPSYFQSKFSGDPNVAELDSNAEHQKHLIEDELFAKAIFEDSLFAADLHANPEWVLEEMQNPQQPRANDSPAALNHSKYGKYAAKNSSLHQKIDPSDMNARRVSFQQRFNNLGLSAKAKMADLAQKLHKHKEQSKQSHQHSSADPTTNAHAHHHTYTSVLTSLDDQSLMEDESLVVDDVSELHRGTYAPPVRYIKKPQQAL